MITPETQSWPLIWYLTDFSVLAKGFPSSQALEFFVDLGICQDLYIFAFKLYFGGLETSAYQKEIVNTVMPIDPCIFKVIRDLLHTTPIYHNPLTTIYMYKVIFANTYGKYKANLAIMFLCAKGRSKCIWIKPRSTSKESSLPRYATCLIHPMTHREEKLSQFMLHLCVID